VRAEFKKASRVKSPAAPVTEEHNEPQSAPVSETPRPSATEFWLLKLLLVQEDTASLVQRHLDLNWVQHTHVRQALSTILAAHAHDKWLGVAAFLAECEQRDMQNLVTEATAENRSIANARQQLEDIITRLRNQFIDRQLAVLTQRAHQPGLTEDEHLAVIKEQQALRALKRDPLTQVDDNHDEPF
jgi:hypothetical protein